MTRAQRRIRSAKLRATSAGLGSDFRVMPSSATENPNNGLAKVATMRPALRVERRYFEPVRYTI